MTAVAEANGAAPGGRSSPGQALQAASPARLIVSTGLFVSGLLLLLSWLEHSVHSMIVFAVLAVIFLIVLFRLPSQR